MEEREGGSSAGAEVLRFDPLPGQSLADTVEIIHREMAATPRLREVTRIALALYDPAEDLLKTFVHSTEGGTRLALYEYRLAEVPSLKRLADSGRARAIGDIASLPDTGRTHTKAIKEAGFRSSFTLPVHRDGLLFGILFFNSRRADYFGSEAVEALMPYARAISLAAMHDVNTVRTILAAVATLRDLGSVRDQETGAHLERMSRYARLIAVKLAPSHGFDDEHVEFVHQLAPLHDIGKVGIPDNILLKPGPLDAEEFSVIKTHVERGVRVVETLIAEFGLGGQRYARMLRDIVAGHHEAMDGTGYPCGLEGAKIPIEARICAVADVFDALTSQRPYKRAWTNDEAIAFLAKNAGDKFDPECVAALAGASEEIQEIQNRFRESPPAA